MVVGEGAGEVEADVGPILVPRGGYQCGCGGEQTLVRVVMKNCGNWLITLIELSADFVLYIYEHVLRVRLVHSHL